MTTTLTDRLSNIGSTPAISCEPTATIAQVARQMAERDIGAVVVSTDRRVVGIVTDRDLIIRGIAAGADVTDSVSSVMSHDVACVADTTSTVDAARQMAVQGCRRLPILDDVGRLIGVVSTDDLIRHDADSLELLGRLLSQERRHPAESA